jgi:SAM-dependent methyltransferase
MAEDHLEHHHHHDQQANFVELLDLDAAVMHAYWADVLGWLRRLAAGAPHQNLLDLGAGTGVASIGLAQRFAGARVTALDLDEASLARIGEKAMDLGLADRVVPRLVNLDDGLPALGTIDLTWASMSMHHFGDPDQVLREVLASTRPGGLIAVAEFSDPVRILPDSVTREARWLGLLQEEHAAKLPHLGADWSQRLTGAGFELVAEREIAFRVTPADSAAVGRFAQLWLRRLQAGLDDRLDDADRAELDKLTADEGAYSVLHREDLAVRGVRTVTVGRRPLG